VLVRAFNVGQIGVPKHRGQARINALRLQPRVTDRCIGFGMRHNRGKNEEAIFKLVNKLAVFVLHSLVVRIHEDV
jgi:hypothetical protein